jgi:putative MATE family efflux protein
VALLRDRLDRRIVGLAIPALGALAIEPLYVLVDTAIVGRLGTTPLAGLALASSVLLLVVAGCNFLAYGTTQRLAHHRGAGRHEDAAAVGVQALWLAMALGVPLAVAVAALAEPAARLLGGSGDVLEAATTYLRISAIGLPFVLVALVGNGVLRGVADLRTPLVVALVANAANVVLELLFVYGLDYGIAGSASSTVIVQAGAAVAYLAVIRRHLQPAVTRKPDREHLVPLLAAGQHLLVRVGAMLAVFTASTAVAARVDDATLAAHQIVLQVFSLFALVVDALAIPAQTLVAAALGGEGLDAATTIGRRVLRLSLLAGVGLAAILVAVAWPLPWVFTDDADVASRAAAGLVILALAQPAAGAAMGLDGVLIGGGDYRFLARASVAYLGAFAPLAVATLVWPVLGIVGVWLAIASWLVARAIANAVRFERRRWTHALT